MTHYRDRLEAGEFAAQPVHDLDQMTKDELLEYARAHGIAANAAMSKGDIRSAIEEAAE